MLRLTGGLVSRRRLASVALVLVPMLVLVPPGRCRPQTSSAGHPGGYHSTLLQYLSGIQQELPPDRQPSDQQQQQLVNFLQTQQQQQQQSQQSLTRPQQQQQQQLVNFLQTQQQQQQQQQQSQQSLTRSQQQFFSRLQQQQQQQQQFSRPQSQSFGRQQRTGAPASLSRSVTAARTSPSGLRRRPGGAIIFPGPAS